MIELRQLLGLLVPAEQDDGSLRPQPGLDQLAALVDRVRATGLEAELTVTGIRRALPPGLDLHHAAAGRTVRAAGGRATRIRPGPVCADPPRARGPRPDRPGHVQRRARGGADAQRGDGEDARGADLQQARPARPRAGRRPGLPDRPDLPRPPRARLGPSAPY